MKRIRYLAGAAGLAPAAVGMALAPGTAQAATSGVAGPAKTVSLHHVLGSQAANAAAVSSGTSSGGVSGHASSANSPDTTAGCTGNTAFHLPRKGSISGHGWYANGPFDSWTCVGTVDISMHFVHKGACKTAHLSLRVQNRGGSSPSQKHTYSHTLFAFFAHSVCE